MFRRRARQFVPGQCAAVLVVRTRSEREHSVEHDLVHLVQRGLPVSAAAVGVAGQQPFRADRAGEGGARMGELPGAALDVRVLLGRRVEQAGTRVDGERGARARADEVHGAHGIDQVGPENVGCIASLRGTPTIWPTPRNTPWRPPR
jgi:hypothetical protein